ncbi:valine--pyruvate aminotransferase [Scheffersomyces amazonensis]|uniref:valine--pyruvate aminotransferase n=1 Tax=Scheffersomyces amazonensis TaxID=1078765 RepID=UPI00315C5CF0
MSINFFKGHPTRSLLPVQAIANAYNKVLLDSDYLSYETDPLNQHPLQYGTDPGNYDVRKSIAQWTDKRFGRTSSGNGKGTDPDTINLTAGASYGVANILTSVTEASTVTKRAFIVTPTYYLITSSFLDTGFEGKLTAINETPDEEYEIDLKTLEEKLIEYGHGLESSEGKEINIIRDPVRGDRKLYRFVLYIVPTFSNPGGLSYSEKTRVKLIEIARKYDLLVISDDVYEFLDYTDSKYPIPRLVHLDQDTLPPYKKYGNTISNGTFSKLIAPGLRVGWQETPTTKFADQLAITGANRSGGTPGQLASLVVQHLINDGELDKIILDFVKVYKSRSIAIQESIKKYLPKSTRVLGGQGGYFLWVTIPGIEDHTLIVKELAKNGVTLAGGENFEVAGDTRDWGRNSVRLSLSYLPEEELRLGIKLWGKVLQEKHPELY